MSSTHAHTHTLLGLDVCTDITLDRKKWEDLFEPLKFFSLYK